MSLADIFKRNNSEKVSLVTNNSEYFLFYKETTANTSSERLYALEKVSDLTKCATMGVTYHFNTVEEADEWLIANYSEYEEF